MAEVAPATDHEPAPAAGFSARYPLLVGILRVGLAFAVLSGLYVLAENAFPFYFRTVYELLFVVAGSWDVEFVAHEQGNSDTLMRVLGGACGEGSGFGYVCDSRFVALIPMTIYLALAAGPRMTWARRWRSTLMGLALIHGYVFLRLMTYLLEQWTQHAQDRPAHNHPDFLASDWWNEIVSNLGKMQSDPAVYVTVPVIIWGLVSFRRLDWETLLARRGVSST